ncbi:Transmembrane protein like [Actinidia chinensis var. chinensis]|uniref:Transmembrane protein like n=1 Tax=Actinidia chinensis var. chinensis TaxID=1590841 RepID=A0A2R6Q8Z0_ACTCC|nr:Transmembrane protein like [Actinidia chinensis var. chinensis]
MAGRSILGGFYLKLCLFVTFVFIFLHGHCLSNRFKQGSPYNSFTVSSFRYSKTELKPYEWRYIKVDLPPWFSSMSLALESDVDSDPESIKNVPTSKLPMICLREGSPPLPDVHNTSLTGLVLDPTLNGSFGNIQQGLQNAELCYPLQKNMSVTLTNEQISPGVWYWGLFNGIGPTRTQSKMINRGAGYSFSGNVSVEGCTNPTLWGQSCNRTVNLLSCDDSYNLTENLSDTKLFNQTADNVVFCRNSGGNYCHEGGIEPKIYSLDVVGIVEQLTVMATNVRLNETTSSNGTRNGRGFTLMCYARHGAIPLATLHDYSTNISEDPLVIRSPKVGRWYIAVHLVILSNEIGGVEDTNAKVCYSLDWLVLQCPEEKAGLNCTCERYVLQTVLRKNPSNPFEASYKPLSEKVSSDSADFPVEPLLSNSYDGKLHVTWTYFLLDIPYGGAGGNLHVQLTSDTKINYEIYAKYGGLPSLDSWDYFYANTTSSSNSSMFFKLYDSDDRTVSFYVLYARAGTWSFGLRQLNPGDNASKNQTTMSISLQRCPRKCSSPHGTCQSVVDASGLSFYSYCSCDRNHGGFDCSVEIVSHQGHIWQSVALIASNAAALLPAYWSLHQKAFAEWVLFMSSGISSGLYHACDVGTWCPLPFRVLQFMDFWLSFMAVVSTFLYLSDISEVSKRTIHTVVAIVTALMAATGPTRSTNIVLVMAIGASGLLIGWLIEFCTKHRSLSFPTEICLNLLYQWQAIKGWLHNLVKMLLKRFRWGFVLAAFTALAMAAISWTLESSESYWIWHSLWHVSIYTSSFLFLCSKANIVDGESGGPQDGNYELTRQNSFSRGE